jgi:hypothetical protein
MRWDIVTNTACPCASCCLLAAGESRTFRVLGCAGTRAVLAAAVWRRDNEYSTIYYERN